MPANWPENDFFHLEDLQLPAIASKEARKHSPSPVIANKKGEQKPTPSYAIPSLMDSEPFWGHKNIGWRSDLPSEETNERFDSDEEVRTKRAVEEYLTARQEPPADLPSASIPDVPVQYDNPTAAQLHKLFYRSFIEGDKKQNIHSEVYKAKDGKVIFCMDVRNYDANEEIDSCYSYARYGIGLYVSQHLLYNIYGQEDTTFIAENAQRFYEQFIADIQRYQSSLATTLDTDERAEKLKNHARKYLSDIAHNIAEQLTDAFGEKKEFANIEASLKSLDRIVPAASMAFQPIPQVTIEKFEYNDPKLPDLSNISENHPTIIHPLPGKMAEDIQQYWQQESSTYNFLAELHPCERGLFRYFQRSVLEGTVTLPSQYRSKFPGAKNVRKFEQMRISKDENGQIQLVKIGEITGSSTTLTAFKKASDDVLIDCNAAALLQQHLMMARGTNRGLRSCNISLCSIDLSTAFANKISKKITDPLDAKIIRTTYAAAKKASEKTGKKFFTNNEAINFERYLEDLQNTPELVQKFVGELTNYDDLQAMLPYIHHTEGINENVDYIETFRNEFEGTIENEDLERLDAYIALMRTVQALHKNGALDKLELFLDTIAIFSMLCNVYNELILKYDAQKIYDNIIVPINCASGENRTGAAVSHCLVLSRAADIVVKHCGIDELANLLDPKYYPLRRAIGDHLEKIGLIGRDNESPGSTLGTKGTRDKSEGSISRINVSKKVRKTYVCRPEADFKSFIADVYVFEKDRIDILRDATLKEIVLGDNIVAKQKAYRAVVDKYSITSILYTLRNLRAPDTLKWLPAKDAELIHTLLIEKVEAAASKGLLVQDNLGLYLPPIQAKTAVMDLAVVERVEEPIAVEENPHLASLPMPREEKKPSLTKTVLNKIATLVPKNIEEGLGFFSTASQNKEPIKQDTPCPSLPSIQSEDAVIDLGREKGKQRSSLPQEGSKKRSDTLKMGSIIAGLFVVIAPIVAFVELHGISIFAAVTLAASAITGWWYAREETSDKKNNSPYSKNRSQTFFGPGPEPKPELIVNNTSANEKCKKLQT